MPSTLLPILILVISVASWVFFSYVHTLTSESSIEEVSSFLDFVQDVSSFHPSNAETQPQLAILQEIYNVTLRENCEITKDAFLHIYLQKIGKSRSPPQLHDFETYNVTDKLQKSVNFVQILCKSVGQKRRYYQGEFDNIPSVIVVGAGPTGLGNAIEAYAAGANVQVFEKRDNYSRSLWLDLMAKPWSNVHDVLSKWGWKFQQIEAQIYSNPELWTVRIQTLERFLSKVASIVGILIHYKQELVTVCHSNVAVFKNSSISFNANDPCVDESLRAIPFHLLIGSDSASSSVRKSTNITYQLQESFQILGSSRSLPGIKQVTMIANFGAKNGKCPELATDKSGAVLSPWYPSFTIQGVNSVWKRFYYEHCQLQVLFHDSLGQQIWTKYDEHRSKAGENWEQEAISWDYLLKIVNSLFKHKYIDKEELQRALLRKKNGEYDIQTFPVMIRKGFPLTLTMENQLNNRKTMAVVALVGDAAVTAHYRLGIGINNAFSSFGEVGDLVKRFGAIPGFCWNISEEEVKKFEDCKEKITAAVAIREKLANERVDKLVNFQLSAMYYESYCDFVVAYNTEKDVSDAMEIFRRDTKRKRFDEILDESELIDCHKKI